MKKWITLLSAIFVVAAITPSAHAQQFGKTTPTLKSVIDGNNTFAANLYSQLANKDGNLFFSPYSISNALAMTYAGARGKTATEMADAMQFNLKPKQFHPAFSDLVGALQSQTGKRKYKLSVANRLWGQKGFAFQPPFLKLVEDNYLAGLKTVDFVNATEAARKEINQWVENETNKKIKDLLKRGVLTVDTRLVLTNAIYFKAAWMRPFNKNSTKPGVFFNTGGNKAKVPMMNATFRGRYFATETMKGVELPYERRELSMLVFMPTAKDGMKDLEKSLTFANIEKWRRQLSTHLVTLSLPKFKITAEFALADALKAMGMRLAFNPAAADLSGMSSTAKLFISAVIHKAFVDVNEAGTEAAASTAVVVSAKSLPPRGEFIADHPFVFLIRDNRTGSILFMGRVSNL